MKLSIVTALYRSAPYIVEFHRRITAAASAITDDFEILMVDDGSPDDSLEIARQIVARDGRVSVLELSRNFGHHKAMMTGLEAARGDFVFLIDVDLEEEPEWLPVFWTTRHETGADVVYGYQTARKGSALERLGGAFHWWMIRRLSYYPIPENLVTARLMTRQYVRSLVLHREQKTAIGGLWAITGYKQVGLPVVKGSRGATTYSLASRLAMGFEGITSFSEKPLVLVFTLGIGIFVLACVGAVYLTVLRLSGSLLSGWASVMVSVWMLGGLCIASIGILGLYIARIFIETKQRPYAIIRAVHGAHAAMSPPHDVDVQARSTGARTV
jgi:putative glycosyltransferase